MESTHSVKRGSGTLDRELRKVYFGNGFSKSVPTKHGGKSRKRRELDRELSIGTIDFPLWRTMLASLLYLLSKLLHANLEAFTVFAIQQDIVNFEVGFHFIFTDVAAIHQLHAFSMFYHHCYYRSVYDPP